MKITNQSNSPKAFYQNLELVTLKPGESITDDFDEGLLNALMSTGFEVTEEIKEEPKAEKPKKPKAE